MENIFFVVISFLCGVIFVAIGVSCFKRTKPAGFWSGVEVKKEQVTDVKKYNIANGIMWCIFSTLFWISGIAAIYDSIAAVIIMVINCTFGIVGLIVGYGLIKRKFFISYKYKNIASKLNDYK